MTSLALPFADAQAPATAAPSRSSALGLQALSSSSWSLRTGWRPMPITLVLLLHLALLAGLLQLSAPPAQRRLPANVQVRLLSSPTPSPAVAPSTAPTAPLAMPTPTPSVPALPMPSLQSLAVEPVNPTPAVAPPSSSAAAPSIASPASSPTPSLKVEAPARRVINAALRYRVEPAVEVPRLSRRAGEQGRVQLRVVFDAEGRPRQLQLLHSSGFARLDAQALEAMALARIHPPMEGGRPIEVEAIATLEYQLD